VEDRAGKEKIFVVMPWLAKICPSPDNPFLKIFFIEREGDSSKDLLLCLDCAFCCMLNGAWVSFTGARHCHENAISVQEH
jgi:hypothetical protein